MLWMKFLTLFLFICSLQVSAGLHAQMSKVTLQVEQVSFETVMKMIESSTEYTFLYRNEQVASVPVITLEAKEVEVEKVLDQCLRGTNLTYQLVKQTIVIVPKEDTSLPVQQQRKTLQGKVLDEQGLPLPGAALVIRGSSLGTVTDANGEFKLEYTGDNIVLIVTFIGYKRQEVAVENRTEITVRMEEDTAELDDIVVVGYGTAKKKDITGSVVRISEKLIERSSYTDLGKMLQGQVAGMEIMQGTGRPGDRIRIRIRGESTLQGDASPLIVIDDVPMPEDYDINMINPNDVQNIDVLKGASAAAIYGSKGSAGVLLISTKQGRDGTPEVSYVGNVAFKNFETPVKTLNGNQFRELIHESVLYNFRYAQISNPAANYDLRAHSDYKLVVVPGYFEDANTDWMDVLSRNPINTNHTLGLRGGNKSASYYTSLGYTSDRGRIIGTDWTRITLNSSLDIRATSFLEMGLRITGSKQKIKNSLETNGWDSDYPGLAFAASARPDLPVYDENGDYYRYYSTGHTRYLNNPLQLAEMAPKKMNRLNYMLSAYARVLFTPDLRYQLTYSWSEGRSDSRMFWGTYTYNGSGGYYNDAKGILQVSEGYDKQANVDNVLYYTKTLEQHDISAMIGTTFNQEMAGSLSQEYSDFPDDYIQNAVYSAARLTSNSGSDDKSAYFSVYGRVNYKYKDRYLLTATLRRDASSKFSPKNRAGWFPSLAAGWILSEEAFLKENKLGISFLKIRGGWGITGDNRIGRYTWRTRFTSADYFDKPGSVPMSVGNDEVKWEQAEQIDLALEYGFWQNRIRGTLGYYTKNTKGLLYAYSMPPSAGITSVTLNMAKIHNQGVEFDINAQLIEQNDITLALGFNISKNKGKVLNLDRDITSSATGSLNLGTTVLKEGEPLGLFYGYKCLGIVKDQQMSDALYEKYGYRFQVGRYAYDMYADETGDQRVVLGKTVPDYYGGFSVDFRYKQITFRAAGKYSVGAKKHWTGMMDQYHANLYNPANVLSMALNRWTPDNPNAAGQRFGSGWESYYVSDNYLFDASFLKLTDITIGYDLPFEWLRKLRISNLHVYGAVNNVFTLTKYPGTNVESYDSNPIIGSAQDYSIYPLERTFTFGVKIMFR